MSVRFVIEHANQDERDPHWQWVLIVDGDRIAISWDAYHSHDEAERAAVRMRDVVVGWLLVGS